MKKILGILGVTIGALAYSVLVFDTLIGSGDGLSFSTFALWAMLAWISAFSMLKQGANPLMAMVYGVGSVIIATTLVYKGKYCWSTLDTVVTVLVLVCVVLWKTHGPKWALYMSVTAGVIASVPFVIMTWKNPEISPIVPNAGAVVGNLLTFLSAKAWTAEDRLYSGVNVILCSLLVLPWLVDWLLVKLLTN